MATIESGLPTSGPTNSARVRHPRGLATLFFTELWERFSYYGMRAILVLYMVAPVAQGRPGLRHETCGLHLWHLYDVCLFDGTSRRDDR